MISVQVEKAKKISKISIDKNYIKVSIGDTVVETICIRDKHINFDMGDTLTICDLDKYYG